jgi:hypothetical protein
MGVVIIGLVGALLVIPGALIAIIADFTWRGGLLLAAAALLAGGYYFIAYSETFHSLYWQWALATAPPDEKAFIAAAEQLQALRLEPASTTSNALALGQAESRLCALPTNVDDWVGRVTQVYENSSSGGTVLTVSIWPHLVVRTAFYPDQTGTLINAGSPVFAQASNLRQRDVVRFSGRIIGHDGACPGDPQVDRNEMLRDPEFLFVFTQVATSL